MREQMAAHALGLNLASLVFAIVYAADHDTSEALEDPVATVPHIIQAQRLLGDPDRLLHVVAAELAALQGLYDDHLTTLPRVQRLSSTLVMKNVVQDRPLPL